MGSRDRDAKSIQEKFKVFFKKAGVPARGELQLTAELERELSADVPLSRRLRAVRELAERALQLRIQDGGVERVWRAVRDLLDSDQAEARGAVLGLLRCVAEGQADRLTIMRTVLFKYLRDSHATHPPEDTYLRFRLLHTLTNTGKNITCFEEQIGAFLVEWMPQIQNPSLLVEFLQLVTNVVKFNASSLDEDIVHGIVNGACLWVAGGCAAAGGAALALLEAVVSYSLLPRGALRVFVSALCRAASVEAHLPHAWKLVRGVAGGDLGPAALLEMVRLARAEPHRERDPALVRGAVFYVNMALWGPRRVPALRVSYLAVLPAFRRAVELGSPVVTYEVLQALQALVARAPHELDEPAWEALLHVLRAALDHDRRIEPRNELIHTRLHALITSVEQLQLAGQWDGPLDELLALVEAGGAERPEASSMWLVSARAAELGATSAAWAPAALQLAERFLRHEPRRAVRLHTLDAIKDFILRNKLVFGEELVERVALPVLSPLCTDADGALRAAAARAAAELARATGPEVTGDLVDLLERILNRPFDMFVTDVPLPADADAADLRLAARGLLELLHDKLPRAPPAPAARAALVLLDHLDHHYRRPALLAHHPDVRLVVFDMLFALRVNAFNCVGLCGLAEEARRGARPVFSPHVQVEALAPRGAPAAAAAGACVLPAGRAARALVTALQREADWAVLAPLLRALPALLAVRALCVGRRAQDLDLLASTLCAMVSDRSLYFPECLRVQPPHKLTLSEFQSVALPPLAALAPYHAFLEPHTQQRIVRCLLKFGMVLRTPQPYINALTIFTLEMRETMVKMLPEVLLDLSKISDTKLIASPMLEFLSTLTRLPRVFASFVEDQYMSVFAILLPYTNPSRYNHYVVSLAHHVIAAWFLKCRLSYRRNFVRFIIHGLHNYIILPFEERLQRAPANEDSSNRQRSSSLGSRAVSRAPLGARGGAGGAGGGAGGGSAAFHVELTETCVDLLARYAFTAVGVKPARAATASWLFAGGRSATWLVGHRLVTVTTPRCAQAARPAQPAALCDRCAAHCRRPPGAQDDSAATGEGSDERRGDPVAEALAQLNERLQRIERETEGGEGGRWAAEGPGAAGAAGGCTCWCAQWAEVRVRAPTGDTAWVTRLQNEADVLRPPDDLDDLHALLLPPEPRPEPDQPQPAHHQPQPAHHQPQPAHHQPQPDYHHQPQPQLDYHQPQPQPQPERADLYKSSSDSVVRAPAPSTAQRQSTQPINIPGSPQRQSSSSTTDDDDLLLVAPSSKSRQPVRRSNSSPEMSSWKLAAREEAPRPPPPPKKPAKKSDMRVSCEAIPEEMSGTSPHQPPPAPHPALATFNSDPGEAPPPPALDRNLQKTASDSTVGPERTPRRDDLPPLARSKRSNTISVMSPTRRHRDGGAAASAAAGGATRGSAAAAGGGGLTPAFVFLQLYHNMSTYPITPPVPGEAPTMLNPLAERPLKVSGVQHERTIKNLDLVPPLETYKVGVLYVGAGQTDDEVAILRNEYGSVRYADFLSQLGTLVSLEEGEEAPDLFLNLEKGGKDGLYTYVWTDDIMQVQFHVATAMPSSPKDPNCNEKRKYIGNDYVSIVYNDSGADFNIHTIKGQLNFCIVVVEPFEHGMNRVFIKTKDERIRTKFLSHMETHIVSDPNVALLARQIALHCSLASQISQSLKLGGAAYASNALERLRLIKRLRRRAEAERLAAAARAPEPYAGTPDLQQRVAIDDFNDYT